MKKSVMKKWVAALRSGKYKQGEPGYLKDKKGGYCCLGVLLSELGLPTERNSNECQFLLVSDLEICSLSTKSGRPNYESFSLATLNDGNFKGYGRFSFEEIADIIEFNYRDL